MSHHHDHHNGHDHHHGHAHSQAPLSFAEKLVKLLEHWVQHNDHHAQDYRQWANDARENRQGAVADLLDQAADLTDTISKHFREAGDKVRPS